MNSEFLNTGQCGRPGHVNCDSGISERLWVTLAASFEFTDAPYVKALGAVHLLTGYECHL